MEGAITDVSKTSLDIKEVYEELYFLNVARKAKIDKKNKAGHDQVEYMEAQGEIEVIENQMKELLCIEY